MFERQPSWYGPRGDTDNSLAIVFFNIIMFVCVTRTQFFFFSFFFISNIENLFWIGKKHCFCVSVTDPILRFILFLFLSHGSNFFLCIPRRIRRLANYKINSLLPGHIFQLWHKIYLSAFQTQSGPPSIFKSLVHFAGACPA